MTDADTMHLFDLKRLRTLLETDLELGKARIGEQDIEFDPLPEHAVRRTLKLLQSCQLKIDALEAG